MISGSRERVQPTVGCGTPGQVVLSVTRVQVEEEMKSKTVSNIPPLSMVSPSVFASRVLSYISALASHDNKWILTFKI